MSAYSRPAPTAPRSPGAFSAEATARVALAGRNRPPRTGALRASFIFGWRALLRIKHVPEQLFDVTAFPVMFTVMFTFLFGGALAGSPEAYLQFLLPGILVQTIVFITIYTGMGLNTDIQKGFFDRVRSLPVWQPAAIVGALLGDVARYTIAASIVIGLGLALGFRPQGGVTGVVLAVLLVQVFAFGLTWIWAVLGMVMQTANGVMMVSMLLLFPGTFASNIFVDPATMPGWLSAFVRVNPVSLLATAVRGLMHGTPALGPIAVVLLVAAGLTAVFGTLTMMLYRSRQ